MLNAADCRLETAHRAMKLGFRCTATPCLKEKKQNNDVFLHNDCGSSTEFCTAASTSSSFCEATEPGGALGERRSTVVALVKARATGPLGVPLTSLPRTGVEGGKEGAASAGARPCKGGSGSAGAGPLDLTMRGEGDGLGDDTNPSWLSGWYDSTSGNVEATVSTPTASVLLALGGVATGTAAGTLNFDQNCSSAGDGGSAASAWSCKAWFSAQWKQN